MVLLFVYACLAALVVLGGVVVIVARQKYLLGLSAVIATAAVAGLAMVFLTPGVYFGFDGYFGDFWTATEAVNKTKDGLLSSVDYYSPIGPVYGYVFALWLLFDADPTAATILQASALAALIAAAMGILILRRHVSTIGLAVAVFSIIGIAVSGRGNGELLHEMPLHYVAPYNRWAWALFIPVALRLALPYRRDLLGDVVLGIAIALLLMLKVTYGAAAIGLVAARVCLLPSSWRAVPLIVSGLVSVLAAIELTTGQVSAHVSDLAFTARLPQSGLRLYKLFEQLGEAAIYSLAAIVLYFGTLHRTTLWSDLRPVLLILLVAGAGCAVLMQNHYSVEAAIYPLLPLLALEWTGTFSPGTQVTVLRKRVLLAGAIAAMLVYPAVDIAMHLGQRVQLVVNGPDPAFAGTPYADLRFEPRHIATDNSALNTFADGRAGVLEGLTMLREAGADSTGVGQVVALAFANPFPMLLGQSSPSGTPIWLHEGRSFSREIFVPARLLFEGVDYVMSPTQPSTLEEIYADTLEADFEIVAEGDYWVLRVRKDTGA